MKPDDQHATTFEALEALMAKVDRDKRVQTRKQQTQGKVAKIGQSLFHEVINKIHTEKSFMNMRTYQEETYKTQKSKDKLAPVVLSELMIGLDFLTK